jgi:hypothetical protein
MKTERLKMVLQSPSGRNATVHIPRGAAFAAARGIIQQTHYDVILQEIDGTARFAPDGSGTVEWRLLGETTPFGPNSIVCI